MIIGRQQDVTVAATAVMERTSDPRLREIMVSLVQHLHGFVRDTKLTEAEFREATAILAELGRQSTDTHNEVVLMAGSLGVSSLVCLLNNGDQGNTETAQSLLGPFWRLNSPRVENGGSIVRSETPGAALFVTHVSQTVPAIRLSGRRWMYGTPRRSAFTRTRTPNRRR
jgi:catechol 1,2-dioxygenase